MCRRLRHSTLPLGGVRCRQPLRGGEQETTVRTYRLCGWPQSVKARIGHKGSPHRGMASPGRCPEAVRETRPGADLRFLFERDWWPSVHWSRGVLACPAERERPDVARGDRTREWRLLRRMRHIHDRVVLRGRLRAITRRRIFPSPCHRQAYAAAQRLPSVQFGPCKNGGAWQPTRTSIRSRCGRLGFS